MSRINLANYFKQQAYEVIGINPQRMGQQIAQQTATGVEQAINASYAQTEVYFIQHCDYLMPRVHQMRTDLAQYYHSTKPSLRLQYLTTADEKVNFEINGTELLSRELNVFVSTKINHKTIMEQIKQMAIQNNTAGASIYDLASLVKADSMAEVTHALKAIEQKTNAQQQALMTAGQNLATQQQNAIGQALTGAGQAGIGQALGAGAQGITAAMTPQQLYNQYASVLFGTPASSYTAPLLGQTTSGSSSNYGVKLG